MSNQNEELDLSLLDMSMDDIETLPGFETPSVGEYILQMTSSLKKINKNTVVETAFELIECIKKDNAADPDSAVGTKFSNIYTIISGDADADKAAEAQRMGKGKLKELLLGVAEATSQDNLGVLIRDVVGSAVVRATVKRRQDKEDKEKFYPIIKNLMLA